MEISTEKKLCRTFPSHPTTAASSLPRLLYSRRDAAYQWSLSLRAVDYLIAQGRIRTRKVGGRVLIPHEELLRFARADRTQPITSAASADQSLSAA